MNNCYQFFRLYKATFRSRCSVSLSFLAQLPYWVPSCLIPKVYRSHTDTPQLEGLLCTRDRPIAEGTTFPRAVFEPTIPASGRQQTHSLDCSVLPISLDANNCKNCINWCNKLESHPYNLLVIEKLHF